MKKIMLILLLITSAIASVFAQETIEIGDGTLTSQGLPMEPYYGFTISQTIYLKEWINIDCITISDIAYYYNGNSSWTEDNIQIWMAHTNLDQFSNTNDWVAQDQLILVYDGPVTVPAIEGWINIQLDSPFTYNNTQNLLVAFEANSTGWTASGDEFFCTSTTNSQSIEKHSDTVNYEFINPPSGYLRNSFPNTKFGYETAFFPEIPLITSPADNTLIDGLIPELVWSYGENTDYIHVYFSDNKDDVINNIESSLVVDGELVSSYSLNPLENAKVYYWKVVASNADTDYIIETNIYSFATPFQEEGTVDDPYLINSLDNLICLSYINQLWDKHFLQTTDIDASATMQLTEGAGFSPIGNNIINFTGSYNGQNYTISNLYINRPNNDYIGLFGKIQNANISNLRLQNIDIIGYNNVGGLIGSSFCSSSGNSPSISNNYITGTINGEDYVGGLIGSSSSSYYYPRIKNNLASATVSGNNYIGGLMGSSSSSYYYNPTISNNYATGTVGGERYVGGLIGYFYSTHNATVNNSYATGIVSGLFHVGGLVGCSTRTTINSSYATGAVSGLNNVGGLTGYAFCLNCNICYAKGAVNGNSNVGGLSGYIRYTNINNSYATGAVNGTGSSIGGLVGTNDNSKYSSSSSFWDIETSGQTTSAGGNGKTTSQMKSVDTYLNAGWDFDETWAISENLNSGYPVFLNNYILNNEIPNHSINISLTPTINVEVNPIYQYYELYFGSEPTPENSLIDYSPITNPITYTFTESLEHSTDYYWTIALYDSNNVISTFSFSFRTQAILYGTGTETNPYIVQTIDDLIRISSDNYFWDKHFVQTDNIDATCVHSFNNGQGLSQIGNYSINFTGSYNGQGYNISNLYINRPSTNYIGLFGFVNNAEISNLGLINVEIIGNEKVGGLVGYSSNSIISETYARGDVRGTSYVGGLVGTSSSSTITNSYSTAFVSGSSSVGGLVGTDYNSNVNNSFWDVETSGQSSSAVGTGKTSDEMTDMNTFIEAGWDFENTWVTLYGINSNYPLFLGSLITNNLITDKAINIGLTPTISFEVDDDIITYFQLHFGTSPDLINAMIMDAPASNPISYTFTDSLEYSTTYYWKVDLSDIYYNDITLNFTFKTRPEMDGLGSEDNPYLVSSITDLIRISSDDYYLDKHYLQIADIDASSTTELDDGAGFSPIGYLTDYNDYSYFTGSYNGQDFTISNLYINRPETFFIGLFGITDHANISNISIVDVDITGNRGVGAIAGISEHSSNFSYCSATGLVQSTSFWAGGTVGYLGDSSTIMGCSFSGNVICDSRAGGIVGRISYSSTISNSYASGSIYGSDYLGGLIGGAIYANSSIINNCYSTMFVSGDNNQGGLVGYAYENSLSVINSFWDINTSGQTTSVGGIGKTTQEMKTLSTYTDAGWDFVDESANGSEDIWTFVANDYPHLTWECYEQQTLIPPMNLHSRISPSAVNLYWEQTQITDMVFEGYNVYRDNIQINETDVSEEYFIDTDIVSGQTYSYYVTAVFDEEESEPSNLIEVFVFNSIDALENPENLQIVMDGNSALLNWDGVNSITSRDESHQTLYILSYRDNTSQNDSDYYYLAHTFDLTYLHSNIGNSRSFMLYGVKAYENVDNAVLRQINELIALKGKVEMTEVEELLTNKAHIHINARRESWSTPSRMNK